MDALSGIFSLSAVCCAAIEVGSDVSSPGFVFPSGGSGYKKEIRLSYNFSSKASEAAAKSSTTASAGDQVSRELDLFKHVIKSRSFDGILGYILIYNDEFKNSLKQLHDTKYSGKEFARKSSLLTRKIEFLKKILDNVGVFEDVKVISEEVERMLGEGVFLIKKIKDQETETLKTILNESDFQKLKSSFSEAGSKGIRDTIISKDCRLDFIDIVRDYHDFLRSLRDEIVEDEFFLIDKEVIFRPFQDLNKLLYHLEIRKNCTISVERLPNPLEENFHAETKIASHYPLYRDEQKYIGVSKLCCGYCNEYLTKLGYKFRGTHGVCDDKWKMPFGHSLESFKSGVESYDVSTLPRQSRRLSLDDWEREIDDGRFEELKRSLFPHLYAGGSGGGAAGGDAGDIVADERGAHEEDERAAGGGGACPPAAGAEEACPQAAGAEEGKEHDIGVLGDSSS